MHLKVILDGSILKLILDLKLCLSAVIQDLNLALGILLLKLEVSARRKVHKIFWDKFRIKVQGIFIIILLLFIVVNCIYLVELLQMNRKEERLCYIN